MMRWWAVGAGILLAAGQAWAQGTTTPSVDPPVGWRDAITLGIAVLGALLGFLNIWIGIWRDGRKKSADSTYLAMRLAVILEAYTEACTNLLSRNQSAWLAPDGDFPEWETLFPKLPSYPEDGDGWKAMPPHLASACLNLHSRVAGSQSLIREVVEHDEKGIHRAVSKEACARGLEAWSLAVQLRSVGKLPSADTVFDFRGYLDRVSIRLREQQSELDRRSAHDIEERRRKRGEQVDLFVTD